MIMPVGLENERNTEREAEKRDIKLLRCWAVSALNGFAPQQTIYTMSTRHNKTRKRVWSDSRFVTWRGSLAVLTLQSWLCFRADQ